MDYEKLVTNLNYKNIIKRSASEKGDFLEIMHISPTSLSAVMLYGKRNQVYINSSDYKFLEFVPIDAGLLKFCGYENSGNIYSFNNIESFYILDDDGKWFLSDAMNKKREIKYIHEVQQIHKAFLGVEMFSKKQR